jgi:flagellar biosynthesis/type III secretory pathway chaperone
MSSPLPGARLPAPIASPSEGEKLVQHMLDVMDALLATVEEETQLVRDGNLAEAAKLEAVKSDLATLYISDTARIRANQGYLSRSTPELVHELRERHDQFRALLQINLTVLATAHAVSESIMRGVSSELARKATPQAYGASGRATTPSAGAMLPLTVSRVL